MSLLIGGMTGSAQNERTGTRISMTAPESTNFSSTPTFYFVKAYWSEFGSRFESAC